MLFLWRWLRALRDLFRSWWDVPPRQAGKPVVTLLGEQPMGLRYRATLPPPGASDVTSQNLSITENGSERVESVPVNAGIASTLEFSVARDAAVSLKVADVDGSGNVGEYGDTLDFTAVDQSPPPRAGSLTVEQIGQDD